MQASDDASCLDWIKSIRAHNNPDSTSSEVAPNHLMIQIKAIQNKHNPR